MKPDGDFRVKSLGPRKVRSPLSKLDSSVRFVDDDERTLFENNLDCFRRCLDKGEEPLAFEKAGPRELNYFSSVETNAAVVTCGGICPGLNNVIRSLVMELYYRYKVKTILGVKYGYEGMIEEYGHEPVDLTPDFVSEIHEKGGTVLGSSRGNQDVKKMVDTLENWNVSALFCIGGDGTLRGAHAIHEEMEKRGQKISVVGIPKTIDNDIAFIDKTFGFETAFTVATNAIKTAHVEAYGAVNGVGLVKLMGRQSGFIAANAALAFNEVNFVLVPEVPFELEGEKGLFNAVRKRLLRRRHAVIVAAEGAGQNFLIEDSTKQARDASGNIRLEDIGLFLRDRLKEYFKSIKMELNLKYIDPSYIIRSAPAVPTDSIFCDQLARHAVHAAMAGKTDMVVGSWNGSFTHIPIPMAVSQRKTIDPEGELWHQVLEATGQPACFKNSPPA